jgi:polar amino acid transport system substrate-binding protein
MRFNGLLNITRLLVVAGIIGTSAGAALAADVTLYSYHAEPPFVTGENKGLTYELAGYLSKKTGNKFNVQVLPRARVDQAVQQADFKDVVVWVFPPWFKDKDKTTYLWSDPVFPDENIIVSTLAKKVEYTGPESLKGMSFGGVLGHKYGGIDDLVAAGGIERSDANNEETNLKKVAAGRVDATLLPRTSATYLFPELGIDGKVHVSGNPQSSYTRHILVGKKNADLHKQINTAIGEMRKDPAWLETLKKYKVKTS